MKKIRIAILALFMIMSLSTMAISAECNNGTGGAVTISGGTTAGPDLIFRPSPSTLISAYTSDTNYTIIAASDKTTGSDTATPPSGIEYGIDSDTSAMYQMVQAKTDAVTATTSATALPDGFTDKAGNAAPTS